MVFFGLRLLGGNSSYPYTLYLRVIQMNTVSETILEAFNQLPEIEKHALASEIIKQVVMLNSAPLTDDALTEVANDLFAMHDEAEAEDVKTESR